MALGTEHEMGIASLEENPLRVVDEKERMKFILSHPHLFDNTELKIYILSQKLKDLTKRIEELENAKKEK